MKRFLGKLFPLVLAFSLLTFTSYAESGDPQGPKPPNPKSNGAFTAHFTYSYVDWYLGPVTNGVGQRVQNKNFTKDNFTFTVSLSYIAPGTYTEANFGWLSDYDHQLATSFTMVVTDNGDGTGTVTGQAFF